ncbi:MAG: HEAT repeat domain-containing protein [Planctomycetota bacterium]
MMMRRALPATLLALLLAAGSARTDDSVLLKNGAVFEGKVVLQGEEKIVLRMKESDDAPSVEMEFARDKVDRIIYGEGLLPTRRTVVVEAKPEKKAPEPERPEDWIDRESLFGQGDGEDAGEDAGQAGDDGEAVSETADALEEAGEATTEDDADAAAEDAGEEEFDPMVMKWIRQLGHEEDSAQQEARKKLAAYGKDAVRPLIKSLLGADLEQRRYIILTLGDLRDKRAVQVLIEELEAPDNHDTKMRWTWLALKKITGQNIFFDEEDRRARRRFYIDEWRKWFESVQDRYPEQIPIVDEEEDEDAAGE